MSILKETGSRKRMQEIWENIGKFKVTMYASIITAVCLILFFIFFDVVTIKGNEIGVMEHWSNGLQKEPLTPKTYIVPFWKDIYVYPTSVRVFVMNDKKEAEVVAGRETDSYLVQSKDNQDMHLSLQVQWRIDPAHVVELHKSVGGQSIEEKALRPTLLFTVKNKATMREAIEAYSGEGLVGLQSEIENELTDDKGKLRARGIIVDSFVIEHIRLDGDYVGEIQARQLAMIREQRATQEEKAAQAEALKAKAVAQADLNKVVVEAERDKQVAILAAQAANEKVVLEAEAAKQQVVLAAQGEKEAGELKAAAILALGEAEAEAARLRYSAYSAPGAETYAKIEIARAMSDSFQNIKGYLPENMKVFTLSESFTKAIDGVLGK